MTERINALTSAPVNNNPISQSTATQPVNSAFAAMLAAEEAQIAADTAAAEATQEAESSTAGSTGASGLGLDTSFLTTMLLSSMGGTSGLDGGMSSGMGGGLSSIMMFILMFMLMNNGESFGGVSSSDLPSFPSLSPDAVEAEGSAASKAFAAFSGEYGPIVDSALTRLGDPYSQPKAGQGDYTDCSYLSRWCYRQLGIEIPRTAAAQGKYCVENGLTISQEELQPGDLIFYSLKENGRFMDISHVGIYAGNGMMVDASSNAGEVVYRPVFGEPLLYGRPQPVEA